MIATEETIVQVVTRTYTTAAPDTSNIVAEVTDGIATLTYGGSSLVIPIDAMPALTALTAMLEALVVPVAPPVTTPQTPLAPKPIP